MSTPKYNINKELYDAMGKTCLVLSSYLNLFSRLAIIPHEYITNLQEVGDPDRTNDASSSDSLDIHGYSVDDNTFQAITDDENFSQEVCQRCDVILDLNHESGLCNDCIISLLYNGQPTEDAKKHAYVTWLSQRTS